MMAKLRELSFKLLTHTPYSPDLPQRLFSDIKIKVAGACWQKINVLQKLLNKSYKKI